jgi:hypothetical protein
VGTVVLVEDGFFKELTSRREITEIHKGGEIFDYGKR